MTISLSQSYKKWFTIKNNSTVYMKQLAVHGCSQTKDTMAQRPKCIFFLIIVYLYSCSVAWKKYVHQKKKILASVKLRDKRPKRWWNEHDVVIRILHNAVPLGPVLGLFFQCCSEIYRGDKAVRERQFRRSISSWQWSSCFHANVKGGWEARILMIWWTIIKYKNCVSQPGVRISMCLR